MVTENNKLDGLKDRQPFRVPDGYFEGLTEDIMCRLPENPVIEETKVVSLYDRVRPLLYLAAMFAGIIVIINVLKFMPGTFGNDNSGTIVKTSSVDVVDIDEDAEFMEYIEEMYTDKYAISYIDDLMNDW